MEIKDERELENILNYSPESIEKGLKIIDNQIITSKGRIDLLGVDADKVLTIIELKVSKDDDQFKQAVNYFDWVLENSLWLAKVYKKFDIDEVHKPRIILVAPSFTESVITSAKYFRPFADVTLLKYVCVGAEEEKAVVCIEVRIPDLSEIPENPNTIDSEIDYLKVEDVKDTCKKTIALINNLGKNVVSKPTNSYIAFKYKGKNFASLSTRREYFYIGWREEDGNWNYEQIKDFDEIEKIIDNIKKAYKTVGGKIV